MISGKHSHRAIVARAIRSRAERDTTARIRIAQAASYEQGYDSHRAQVTRFATVEPGQRLIELGEDPRRPYFEVGIPDGPGVTRKVKFDLVRRKVAHEVARCADDWVPSDGGRSLVYLFTWFEWRPAGFKVDRGRRVGE